MLIFNTDLKSEYMNYNPNQLKIDLISWCGNMYFHWSFLWHAEAMYRIGWKRNSQITDISSRISSCLLMWYPRTFTAKSAHNLEFSHFYTDDSILVYCQHVEPVLVRLIVIANIMLNPSLTYLMQRCQVHYRVELLKQGKLHGKCTFISTSVLKNNLEWHITVIEIYPGKM